MKTKKQTLGQWFMSLFSKSKKQPVKKSEVDYDKLNTLFGPPAGEEVVREHLKMQEEKIADEKLREIFPANVEGSQEFKDANKPIREINKIFNTHKIWKVFIKGKNYQLTEKQFTFYTIIKKLQDRPVNSIQRAHSKDIMLEFYKMKYPELTISQLKKKIPLKKLYLSNYASTTKYLFKSGILSKVSRNYYKVEVD